MTRPNCKAASKVVSGTGLQNRYFETQNFKPVRRFSLIDKMIQMCNVKGFFHYLTGEWLREEFENFSRQKGMFLVNISLDGGITSALE